MDRRNKLQSLFQVIHLLFSYFAFYYQYIMIFNVTFTYVLNKILKTYHINRGSILEEVGGKEVDQ